jgi:hypothetical protein
MEWPLPDLQSETMTLQRPFTAPAFPGGEGRSPWPLFPSGYGRSLAPAYATARAMSRSELLPLPEWPPLRVYVSCAGRGMMVFPVLPASMLIEELKELVYERLLLSPHSALHLSSWGRPLLDHFSLAEYRLPANARLQLQLFPARPDPTRGLRRVRISSSCLRTRQVQVDEHTTVHQLKERICDLIAYGEHVWYSSDGAPHRRVGGTALVSQSAKADAKMGTTPVRMGDELLVSEVGFICAVG